MAVHTDYLWFDTKQRQEFIRITDQVAEIVSRSGIVEGMGARIGPQAEAVCGPGFRAMRGQPSAEAIEAPWMATGRRFPGPLR